MREIKDKEGNNLHIKDKVEWEEADMMGEVETYTGFVIAFPSDSTVQVQDLEGGLPMVKDVTEVIVRESLIGDLEKATTQDEFLSIVEKMEARYEEVVEKKASKKTKKKPKKPEGPSLFD